MMTINKILVEAYNIKLQTTFNLRLRLLCISTLSTRSVKIQAIAREKCDEITENDP
jgi:hypothetical protein